MNTDDIMRMAKEAGLYTKCEVHSAVPFDQLLTSFAALIAAAERERIAKQFDSGVVNVRARGQSKPQPDTVSPAEHKRRTNAPWNDKASY